MKNCTVLLLICSLVGCAQGRVDVINTQGKVIGECSADFNWHWYGVEDSVNYIINLCAQQNIAKGYSISDESVLQNDYSIPTPPKGTYWNKKTAKKQFKAGTISEQKYGYVLAKIEYEYFLKVKQAENKLKKNVIDEKEYEQALEKAKMRFNGT